MKKYLLTTITFFSIAVFANQLKAQPAVAYKVKTINVVFKGSAGATPNISVTAENTKFFRDSLTADITVTTATGTAYSLKKVKLSTPGAPMVVQIVLPFINNTDLNGATMDIVFNFPATSSGQYTYKIDYAITPLLASDKGPTPKTVTTLNNTVNKASNTTTTALSGF